MTLITIGLPTSQLSVISAPVATPNMADIKTAPAYINSDDLYVILRIVPNFFIAALPAL